jgi:RimJ/RimL family protein N-acetyltransferase
VIYELSFAQATESSSFELFPFWSDYAVTRFTLLRNIKTVADCEKKILRHIDNININGGLGPFCVKNHETTVGYCGATAVDSREGEYEIFYNIGKEHWGNGFGTTIAAYLIDHLFMKKETNRVVAFAVAENVASWKILEKVGMNRVETLVEDFENSEGKFDLYKYEIVQE